MLRRGFAGSALALLAVATCVATAAASGYGHRTLRIGARGSDVRQLQGYLTDLGISTTPDGFYGQSTVDGVKTFERREHQRPDGIVTPAEARLIKRMVVAGAGWQSGGTPSSTGYSSSDSAGAPGFVRYDPSNPADRAHISSDGRTAVAPPNAPPQVKQVIAAANRITDKPYRYGGGHASFDDSAYDCSGSVSYALHGGGYVSRPMDSSDFESWGIAGVGGWITVYTDPTHAYAVIAGLRFDTSAIDDPGGESGPRWRSHPRSRQGFDARHIKGL